MNSMQEIIINLINENPGINNCKLVMKTMEIVYRMNNYKVTETPKDFLKNLEELVNSKELVEVEYILPTMDYRIKSLFFPKGTKINLNA